MPDRARACPDQLHISRAVVTETKLLTPHMRRVTFEGEALATFDVPLPAQWVKVFMPGSFGKAGESQAYTIRRFYPGWHAMEIDVVLHGDTGPASSWTQHVETGDVLHLGRPSGGYRMNPGVCWRLLAGDETALPAIASILEVMTDDVPTWVVIEVPTVEDTQLLCCSTANEACWVVRGSSHPAGHLLAEEVDRLCLPNEAGDIFLAGEASAVRKMKKSLALRAPLASLQAKGYWRLGEADHRDR